MGPLAESRIIESMFQESYRRLQANRPPEKSGRLKRGCFTVLTLLLVIYVAHAQYLIFPNLIHYQRWRLRGAANYAYTVSKAGLLPPDIQAGRRVVVKDGRVAAVTSVSSSQPAYTADIQTVDAMFNRVYACALLFPLLTCSFEYEPFYGYPTQATVDCPLPDACSTRTHITDLEILPPIDIVK